MPRMQWNPKGVREALAALEEAGLGRRRLSEISGVDHSTIGRWARGDTRPGYDGVRDLARGVWRKYPDIARQLVQESGYAWAEPADEPELPAYARENPKLYAALLSAYDGDEEKALTGLRAVLSAESRANATGQPRTA